MVKRVKGDQSVKDDQVVIRVTIDQKTRKALKVKCALMDMTVKEGIRDILDKSVKDTMRSIETIKAKG